MINISHRGNISGPNPERENHPTYILEAAENFDVEIDVWFVNNKFYLGHDQPQYEIALEFLQNYRFWVHCKNIEGLPKLLQKGIHCFWHQTDDVTLTSQGYIWTYPGKQLVEGSIAMIFDRDISTIKNKCAGICSDFIAEIAQDLT